MSYLVDFFLKILPSSRKFYYSTYQPFRIQEISLESAACSMEIWPLIADRHIKKETLWIIQLLNQSGKNIYLDSIEYKENGNKEWERMERFGDFLIDEKNTCTRAVPSIPQGHKVEFICSERPNVGENYEIKVTYHFDFEPKTKEKRFQVKKPF